MASNGQVMKSKCQTGHQIGRRREALLVPKEPIAEGATLEVAEIKVAMPEEAIRLVLEAIKAIMVDTDITEVVAVDVLAVAAAIATSCEEMDYERGIQRKAE
jgi:hypothetical protein